MNSTNKHFGKEEKKFNDPRIDDDDDDDEAMQKN